MAQPQVLAGTPDVRAEAAIDGERLIAKHRGRNRSPLALGGAVAAGCAVLAACLLAPEWSPGDVARWFGALWEDYPWLYWGPGYAVLAVLVAQVALPFFWPGVASRAPLWTSRAVFLLLSAATVLFLRLPGLAPLNLDADESEDVALTLTLREDPRYWLSAEGGTHGPLVEFALLPVRLVGMRLDFASARLVALGLLLGCLCFQLGTLRCFFPEPISRAALTPVTICIAFLTRPGYVVYNAEYATIFVLCAGAYGCARLAAGPAEGVRWRALATGLALGLVPFAKLQGVPIGLTLAAVALWCLLARSRGRWREGRAAALALCAGGLAPAALVAVYLGAHGLFAHFWASYVACNFTYAAKPGWGTYDKFDYFLKWSPEMLRDLFLPYFGWMIGAGLVLLALVYLGGRVGLARRAATNGRLLLAGAAVLLASLYSVVASGYDFDDYLLFLLFPVTFLAAVLLATLHEALPGRVARLALVTAYLASAVAVTAARALDEDNRWLSPEPNPAVWVTSVVHKYASPGEKLVVWGWADHYYVLTGMRPATRQSTYRTIQWKAQGGARGEYFYQFFLREFDAARPPVLVEAVGDWAEQFLDRDEWRLSHYPELRDRIGADYVRVEKRNGVSVYVSKERLANNPRPVSSSSRPAADSCLTRMPLHLACFSAGRDVSRAETTAPADRPRD